MNDVGLGFNTEWRFQWWLLIENIRLCIAERVLTPVALVTAWIAWINQLTAQTYLKFSFLNVKLFGERERPSELNNPETYSQSSWNKDHISYMSTLTIWKQNPHVNRTRGVLMQYDHKKINTKIFQLLRWSHSPIENYTTYTKKKHLKQKL